MVPKIIIVSKVRTVLYFMQQTEWMAWLENWAWM